MRTHRTRRARRRVPAALLAVLAAVAAPLTACGPHDSISSAISTAVPAAVIGGDHFTVTVAVTNPTGTPLTGATVTLHITDAAGHTHPASLPQQVPTVPAGTTAQVSVPAVIAETATPGAATLASCLTSSGGTHCSATIGATVASPADATADPLTPTSSDALIEAALAAGTIDVDTALTYEAYAQTGDQRLPLQYQGSAPPDPESELLRQLPALPTVQQQAIGTLLIPANSHLTAAPVSSGGIGARNTTPTCALSLDTWSAVPADGSGHVKVWYRTAAPNEKPYAQQIAEYLNTVAWPAYAQLMGRQPLSDANAWCTGGDGRLDVILQPADFLAHVLGIAQTLGGTNNERFNGGIPSVCPATPTYIELNDTALTGTVTPAALGRLEQAAAHELFHSFERAFDETGNGLLGCTNYEWFGEASANWAISLLPPLPGSQVADTPPCQYNSQKPLDTFEWPTTLALPHQYAASAFVEWAVGYGFGHFVPNAYGRFATQNSINAIDATLRAGDGVTGGASLNTLYPIFARQLSNIAPNDYFYRANNSPCVAPGYAPRADLPIAGRGYASVNLQHLSSEYFPIGLQPGTRAVRGTATYNPALVDYLGIYNFANGNNLSYSSQAVSASVKDSIVCLYANTANYLNLTATNPQLTAPVNSSLPIDTSDIGCSLWTGTVNGVLRITAPDGRITDISWTAAVNFVHLWNPSQAPGPESFGLSTTAPTGNATITIRADDYNPFHPPGCPANDSAGPYIVQAQRTDRVAVGMFHADPGPPAYNHYQAATAPAGAYDPNLLKCWEGDVVSTSLPWWYTGDPTTTALSTAHTSMAGSYTLPPTTLANGRVWTATWSWNLHQLSGALPASGPQILPSQPPNMATPPLDAGTPPAGLTAPEACSIVNNTPSSGCGDPLLPRSRTQPITPPPK